MRTLSESDDIAAIDGRRAAWMAAFTAGDVAACLDILGADIELIPADEGGLYGKEACRAWLANQHARFGAVLRISKSVLRMGTDRALERADSVRLLQPVDGGLSQRRSTVLVALWRREADGIWRLTRYVESPRF